MDEQVRLLTEIRDVLRAIEETNQKRWDDAIESNRATMRRQNRLAWIMLAMLTGFFAMCMVVASFAD